LTTLAVPDRRHVKHLVITVRLAPNDSPIMEKQVPAGVVGDNKTKSAFFQIKLYFDDVDSVRWAGPTNSR
jgi:hypothetical protein